MVKVIKVIRENANLGEHTFACERCRTVFSADRGEYFQEMSRTEKRKGGFNIFNKYSVTPAWMLTIECPVCGCAVKEYVPTGEPAYDEGGPYGLV